MSGPAAPGGSGFGHERSYEGGTNVWLTPKAIIDALGPFDLDPCAGPEPRPWPTATKMIAPPDDGLAIRWKGRCWVNPPYGPNTGLWLERLAQHGNGIALVFARVETQAFKIAWQSANAVLFPSRRLAFCAPDGTPGRNAAAPSALVAFGRRNVDALKSSGLHGAVMMNWSLQ